MKVAPACTSGTSSWPLMRRQRAWAASSSLNAMAMPASREPAPLVTLVRSRTMARLGLRPSAQKDAASIVIRSVPRRG
jgi:hypothetical protein